MSNNLENGRRNFLKKAGFFLAAGSISPVFAEQPGNAVGAEKSASGKVSDRADKILAMSAEEVKAVRKAAWKEYWHSREAAEMRAAYAKGSGKWKIHMLGTCAGTEPWKGRNHTSWILEKPTGELLWFDAGEYCSWTASLMKIDVLRCKNLFISHPHLDHIGGLPGLFTTMLKLRWVYKEKTPFDLTVHTPVAYPVESAQKMLVNKGTIKGLKTHLVVNGEVYKDSDVVIDAVENNHMPRTPEGLCQSYSYRIKMLTPPNKTIIFTGDIKNEDDVGFFFRDGGCDLLMIETGHHVAENLCSRIKEKYPNSVKDILFLHHGIEILNDPEFERIRAEAVWGKPVIISNDRQTIIL